MLPEIKTWILLSALGITSAVLGYIIRTVTSQVIKRLDEIVHELKQLTQTTTIQGQQIQGLQEQNASIHQRLNEHAQRIYSVEVKANH